MFFKWLISLSKFLITFDDGPSLSNTRKITEKLNYLRMNAIFFILGENLKKVLLDYDKEEL